MLSRRDLLTHAGALATSVFGARLRGSATDAAQPATAVNFDIPAGACDCHTHVFGDARRFPFAQTRVYTPEPASVNEMRRLHGALHMNRVVIVQASVYGTDNACTVDAIAQLGSRARGVAVLGERTPAAQLDELHRAGIRGIRLNLETAGISDPAEARRRLRAAHEQLRGRPWHLQLNTRLSVIDALRDEIAATSVPVVVDHFGGARAALGTTQPGFPALVDLVRAGRVYVKISGAYRSSTEAPTYADVRPLADALIGANPRRIVWGTDWPHPDSTPTPGRKNTDIAPLLQIDDGRLLNQLPAWAPDAALRRLILVDNPAELYGF
jgi:predicted TIM-barrel fold metal-dependent hydrolase